MIEDAPERPPGGARPGGVHRLAISDPSVRRAVRAGVVLAAAVAAVAVLWLAREVVLLGFLAVLVAIVFSFPVRWLSRWVPRGVAVILLLVFLGGAAVGLGAVAAPTLSREADQLAETLPRTIRDVRRKIERVQEQAGAAPSGEQAPAAPSLVREAGAKAAEAALGVVQTLTAAILVLVLAAFLVHRPDAYRRGLRLMVPPAHEATFDEAWTRVRDALHGWVAGILVAMLIMGSATALGLLAIGLQEWLLLGVLTFLGTFVPYVGAVASAVPGLLVALGQSPRTFGLAALVYVGVHLVEGYVVEPLVMRRAVQLKPALLLFTQGVFGAVFGAIGFVVATPALVCGQALVEYLWVERRLRKREA